MRVLAIISSFTPAYGYNLPVFLIDERYTSKFSSEYLSSKFMREEKQKKVLDAYAAARILQKAIDEVK